MFHKPNGANVNNSMKLRHLLAACQLDVTLISQKQPQSLPYGRPQPQLQSQEGRTPLCWILESLAGKHTVPAKSSPVKVRCTGANYPLTKSAVLTASSNHSVTPPHIPRSCPHSRGWITRGLDHRLILEFSILQGDPHSLSHLPLLFTSCCKCNVIWDIQKHFITM